MFENSQVYGVKKLFASLVAAFFAERLRWPLWIPVLMGCGIALYFALPMEPPFWMAVASVVLLLILAIVLRRHPPSILFLSVLLAFSSGFFAANLRTYAVQGPILDRETGPRMVTGFVEDTRLYPDAMVVVLGNVAIEKFKPENTPLKVRLRFAGKNPIQIFAGSHIRVLASMAPPPSPAWPGGYDSRRVLYFQGIGGSGFALGAPEILKEPGRQWLRTFREGISARIRSIDSGPGGQLTDAVLTGNAPVIEEKVLADMRDSGLAHLIAISGMNIGIVAGFVFILLRRILAFFPAFALRHPIKKWAAFPAIAAAVAYTFLAGAPVPAVRSLLMTGLVLVGVVMDRAAISMNLAAFSATVILLLRPETMMGASFQLSFAAVVALIAAFDVFRGKRSGKGLLNRGMRHLGGVAFSSVVAGLATLPFALFHFQRIAFYGVLANMLAVPLTTFIVMPLGFLAMLFYPLGLDRLFFIGAIWGNRLIVADAAIVSSWPGAAWNVPSLSTTSLVMFCLGGLWLSIWKTRWRHAGWAGILVAFVLAFFPPEVPDVFVSSDGKRAGIVTPEGLYISSRRTDGYVVQSWKRRVGTNKVISWPKTGACAGPVCCDATGCVASVHGRRMAFPKQPEALLEDCRMADLVVSPWNLKGRCNAQTLDIQDFRSMGNGMLFWEGKGGFRIVSDKDTYGMRPWIPPYRK
ncbi:MAG TPA: hypothetical protein DCW68_00075 [Rhodospirillaceae bacterium]|nr:MAG: hypothetical protein A2018_04110 [Alphaproteobacteria bacterium GWF2_58_20]HAU28496.1 hypothetical protein [Rhodospirillaceae bacterium]